MLKPSTKLSSEESRTRGWEKGISVEIIGGGPIVKGIKHDGKAAAGIIKNSGKSTKKPAASTKPKATTTPSQKKQENKPKPNTTQAPAGNKKQTTSTPQNDKKPAEVKQQGTGVGKSVEVTIKYDKRMPKREFERKANKLKELVDKGLLYKAENPVPRNPAVTRVYRQDMIKRIWNQYGKVNPEFGKQLIYRVTKRMQPDHVWELQLAGPDSVENLKFLDSFTNWNIGTQQIRPQIRKLPTGTKIKIKID